MIGGCYKGAVSTGIVIRQAAKGTKHGKRPRKRAAPRGRKLTSLERTANLSLLKDSIRAMRGQCVLCLKALPAIAPEKQVWWSIIERSCVAIGTLVARVPPALLAERLGPLRAVHSSCVPLAVAQHPPAPSPPASERKVSLAGRSVKLARGFRG